MNEASFISIDPEKPWFDWYKWRNRYWGTKWGTYDGYIQVGKTTITFVFTTAWSAPYPIYEQILKIYPGLIWEVRYADEDLGNNCGLIQHLSLTSTYKLTEKDLKSPYMFAKNLWKNY